MGALVILGGRVPQNPSEPPPPLVNEVCLAPFGCQAGGGGGCNGVGPKMTVNGGGWKTTGNHGLDSKKSISFCHCCCVPIFHGCYVHF